VDARANPYAPGAGTKPPALTGRDAEIEAFIVVLERLARGVPAQSMIVKGLRGVGKTVLLNTFEDLAVERDWIPIFKECEASTSLPALVARHCRRVIEDLRPTARAAKRLRALAGRLSTFTVVDPNGFELRFDLGRGEASPDPLSDDFVDLLLEVGALAEERGRGVVFLLDEIQFLHANEFGPFVVGLHRINQKGLPVTCVAAGLPTLPALAGEAKSYAERLFTYPTIDRLTRQAADEALVRPAWVRKVAFAKGALDLAYQQTLGYPYFVQEYGKYAWSVASGTRIERADMKRGGELARHALDDGFFLVRAERATEAERRYMRAMAGLGDPPYATGDVVRALGKRSARQLSVQRDSLIRKGLVYSPRTGQLDFTVPMFADFLLRRLPESQLV
jgi:AAA ATPase-like protein